MLGKEVINDKPLIGEAAQAVIEEGKKVLAERNKNSEKTIKERADDFVGRLASSFLGFPEILEGGKQGYLVGAREQKEHDIELVDKWLRKHLPRVISNYPLNENVVTDMLNEDMRADLRKYLRNQ